MNRPTAEQIKEMKVRLDKANLFAPFEDWKLIGTNECHYSGCAGDGHTKLCDDTCQMEVDFRGIHTVEDDGYNTLHPRVAEFLVQVPSDMQLLLNEIEALKTQIDDIDRHHWKLFKEFAEKSDHNMCICCSVIFPKNGPSPHAKEERTDPA